MKLFVAALLVAACCCGTLADVQDDSHDDDIHTNLVEQEPHTVTHEDKVRDVFRAEGRDRLIHALFDSYDKRSYPTNSTVKFGVSLIRFDVDEVHNTVDTDVWLRQQWNDPRLTWNPQDYGGETVVRIAAEHVWKPDITLYNSALSKEISGCSNTKVLVYSTGNVLWVPPCQLKAYCNLTLDVTPYGEQKCGLRFGSWTYDGDLLDLQFFDKNHKADVSDLWDNSDFAITTNKGIRVVQHYACCVEPYPYIEFDFTFHRKENSHAGSRRCH